MGMGEAEACQFVGEEFPDVCGACAPGGVDSPEQTQRPTTKPTLRPTIRETPQPSREPSKEPTREPTKQPSKEPTRKPTPRPILLSTNLPTEAEVYDCTPVDADPWLGRSYTSCCPSLEQCTEPRDPSSPWFAQYPTVEMCRTACEAEVFARGSFGGAVEMIDEGWSFYKVEIQVEPGSTHHYVFSIPTTPGAPELLLRPPRGSSCYFDGEANYGFVAPSTCGGVLSLPAYEWQNGCACAGC